MRRITEFSLLLAVPCACLGTSLLEVSIKSGFSFSNTFLLDAYSPQNLTTVALPFSPVELTLYLKKREKLGVLMGIGYETKGVASEEVQRTRVNDDLTITPLAGTTRYEEKSNYMALWVNPNLSYGTGKLRFSTSFGPTVSIYLFSHQDIFGTKETSRLEKIYPVCLNLTGNFVVKYYLTRFSYGLEQGWIHNITSSNKQFKTLVFAPYLKIVLSYIRETYRG